MPIYEYRCDNRHTFEVMQRMADPPVTRCEVCGAPVHRVFHPVAVHFKGSGFYNTDYGTKKRQRENAAAADGGSSGDSGSKADSATGEKAASSDKKDTKDAAPAAKEKPSKAQPAKS